MAETERAAPGGGRGGPSMLAAALAYAAWRWAVFPLCGKLPWIAKDDGGRGVHDATTDPTVLCAWWTRWREANIGVATGAPSGLWVLDVDPDKGGGESLAALLAQHGPLPITAEQITGGGGRHLLFRHGGEPLRNSAGKLGPGLDVRATGGYIVGAPSVHPDTKRRYRWRPDRHPRDISPADAPNWLLDLIADRPRDGAPGRPTLTMFHGGGYAEAALRNEVEAVRTAAVGTRNDTLNRAAFSLGRLVGGGALDRREVEALLTAAAVDAGLSVYEAAGTLRSGIEAGIARPRGVPSRTARPCFTGRRGWLADIGGSAGPDLAQRGRGSAAA